jgi:hypothetical protein
MKTDYYVSVLDRTIQFLNIYRSLVNEALFSEMQP